MTATRRDSGPNIGLIVVVVVGVIAVAFMAIVIFGGDDDSTDSAPRDFGVVEVDGAPLPPLPDSDIDPAVGATPPAVVSEDPDGTATLDPGRLTEPTMAVFLAHWCSHCQAELPRLVDLQNDGAFDGIRTVAVLTATDPSAPNYPPSEWLDREGWTGDRLFDDADDTVGRAYGVSTFPFMVILDEDGRVVERLGGEQPTGAIEGALDAVR